MKRLFTLVIALWASIIWAQQGTQTMAPVTFTLQENGAPTLHVKEVKNGIVFDKYKGKIILLNFFGQHCPWCMKEIPHLVEMQKKFKKKLQIVAIQAQEPMDFAVRSALDRRFGFNYPIYEYQHNMDFTQYISQRAQWSGNLPFSIIFDQRGSAIKIIPGYASKEDIEKVISALLK